jgi:hypothetical protein
MSPLGTVSTSLETVDDFLRSDHWTALQRLVVSLIGPQTFGLGVVYGMGENVVGGVLGLAQLAKTFLLADLYDRAHQPAAMAVVGPFAPFQRALAEISHWGFREQLEEARTNATRSSPSWATPSHIRSRC